MRAAGAPTITLGLLVVLLAPAWAQIFVSAQSRAPKVPSFVTSTITDSFRSSGYSTAALFMSYIQTFLRPGLTILVPTDAAIASAQIPPQAVQYITLFHILTSNFSYDQFLMLPTQTFLPTLWPDSRVEVVNNTVNNLTLNNAQITERDICPHNISSYVTCQGINQVLNPSDISTAPASPPTALAPAPAPLSLVISPSPAPAQNQSSAITASSGAASNNSSAPSSRAMDVRNTATLVVVAALAVVL